MNRLERRAQKIGTLLAAFVRGLYASDQPTMFAAIPAITPISAKDETIVRLLEDEIAQREAIFAFGVVASIFDHGIAQIKAVQNRIGLLLAAQIAIEAALVLKSNEFAVGPTLVVLVNLVVTAVLFRAAGEPDFVADEPFATAFGERPRQTRDALALQLRGAIARNRRLARGQQRLFSGTLLVTIVALGWAFW